MKKSQASDSAVLMAAFARMDVPALAIALGSVLAVGLFLMTAVLLLKGAPEGRHIGQNLAVLGNYFPGYTVSWGGALVGAVYAWIVGALVGFAWAVLWNLSHFLYIALVLIRSQWWRMLDE